METTPPKIAVYAGSFDPITIGHENIVRRALPLFDKIIVAIGENSNKRNLFSLEQRTEWIRAVFADEPKVEVQAYSGLTVDFCRQMGAKFLVRGLRSTADFDQECLLAQVNQKIGNVETVFLVSAPELSPVQSSVVREIFQHGGDVSSLISPKIHLS